MTYKEMLGRRSEILKRNIGNLLMKDNKQGLSGQENHFYHHLVKELHQNEFALHTARKQS